MSESTGKSNSPQQSDALLWLGGALIVGLGLTWLLLSQPWRGGDALEPAAVATPPASERAPLFSERAPPAAPANGQSAHADLETSLEHNPLRMAELAYEAGMLDEPFEYSAWALYKRAVEQDPSSAAARQGLEKIAGELLKRANVAVDQGRFDDALATIERIRSAIPAHPGANDLAFRIDSLRPQPAPQPDVRQARAETPTIERPARTEPAPAPTPEPAPAAAAPQPAVDPLLAPYQRFGEALASNRLLTPLGASAKHYLDTMIGIDANHANTLDALKRFSDELLSRANAAIIELDAAAAGTWLDEAERLGVNAVQVADARERLRRRLIDVESARRVPVSALEVVRYVPPTFPARALERAFEGWVDLEFTVARDGTTRDIVVTDASHASFFRREAVEAVEQWRFEPRTFMGEVIEQRAYSRIRFTFNE